MFLFPEGLMLNMSCDLLNNIDAPLPPALVLDPLDNYEFIKALLVFVASYYFMFKLVFGVLILLLIYTLLF